VGSAETKPFFAAPAGETAGRDTLSPRSGSEFPGSLSLLVREGDPEVRVRAPHSLHQANDGSIEQSPQTARKPSESPASHLEITQRSHANH
jgi:hypothetical protein